MEGNNDGDRDRGFLGVENSAAEGDGDGDGDGDRGRYSLMVRCASQSSLDESSQRRGAGPGEPGAGHAVRLLGALAALRRDALLCDVRLQAEPPAAHPGHPAPPAPPPVPAHRALLAASSPYFRAMFTQFEERTQPAVTIRNVEPAALEAIVHYVYEPDALRVTEHNVQSLLAAASLLQVGGVRAACCAFLAAALAPDNALGIRAFADLHACADLARAADRFIQQHFVEVIETEEFLALSAETLAQLLASDHITVPDEETVLDAAVRWMQHAATQRRAALGALLESVRLPLLARDVLVARAAAEPLASAPVRVKDLVIEALSFHLMRPEQRAAAAAGPRARPRQPPRAPQALLVVGGQAPKAIRDVEAYRMDAARWRSAAALPSRRCRAGLAVVGGRVFAVGGFNGTLRVRSVDVYDVAADAWSAGPPLGARRSTLGVAVLEHTVYAVGGFDGAAGLSSAEALDTRGEGGWRPIAPMSTRRSSVGVAVLGGKVYAVGGYDGVSRQCLQSVERYDPAADAWEPVADMTARRSGAGVGVVLGALYAVGGHDGPAVRRSVERYSAGADAWQPAAAMTHARRNAGVAAHRGRLYAVGGDDGAANLPSVEVYDPVTDAWTLLGADMAVGRSYAGVYANIGVGVAGPVAAGAGGAARWRPVYVQRLHRAEAEQEQDNIYESVNAGGVVGGAAWWWWRAGGAGGAGRGCQHASHARASQTLEFNERLERLAAPLHVQGTVPGRLWRRGVCGVRVEVVGAAGAGGAGGGRLSSSCGTIDAELPPRLLLQRCRAPPAPAAVPPAAPAAPRPSCSYHLLPESHRAHTLRSHHHGGAAACCDPAPASGSSDEEDEESDRAD